MNLGGFLGNESAFGRLMTKCGTIIAINLLFAVSSIPFFTIGAAGTAMYHAVFVLLEAEAAQTPEDKGAVINPFLAYWQGLRKAFVPATLCWLVFVGIMLAGTTALRIYAQWDGWFKNMSVGVIAVMAVAILFMVYMMPVLAVFSGSRRALAKRAFLTAAAYPLRTVIVLILQIAPLLLIYMDEVNRPTYAFIGTFFGFGLTAYLIGNILRRPFGLLSQKDEPV